MIKIQKNLENKHQRKLLTGKKDSELEKNLKKHRNYCNKMIKKAVKERAGKNITSVSTVKQVWSSINDIIKPDTLNKHMIKIQTEGKVIEDPLELAETFNVYFKEKVEKLAAGIKRGPNFNPFLKLKKKLHGRDLKFKLLPVNEKLVFKLMKSLKPKRSCGLDGISSEILKLGAEVLVIPLTYMINYSILTGKFPTNWKISKVVPLHKKGDKSILKNYRPVSLLPVAGMILEKVVALQIEEYFETNNLLGSFQFGFRRHKNTISELITLFDTLLEAKSLKKEILVLLYDLSAAFDTVCHQILLEKLQIYGFCPITLRWMESYLGNRKQIVEISGKKSSKQEINMETPQGSRLSPLLFIILMADLDLWTEDCVLSNFADDTQSIIISESRESLLEITKQDLIFSKKKLNFCDLWNVSLQLLKNFLYNKIQ